MIKFKICRYLLISTVLTAIAGCAPPPASKLDKTYGDSVRNMVAEQKRFPDAEISDEAVDGLTGEEADRIINVYRNSVSTPETASQEATPGVE